MAEERDSNWNRLDLPIMTSVTITPGATEIKLTKAIHLSEDDTVSVTYDDDSTDSLALAGKVWHRMAVKKVTAVTGAATVKAGY